MLIIANVQHCGTVCAGQARTQPMKHASLVLSITIRPICRVDLTPARCLDLFTRRVSLVCDAFEQFMVATWSSATLGKLLILHAQWVLSLVCLEGGERHDRNSLRWIERETLCNKTVEMPGAQAAYNTMQ